jgi:hypothetical protein
MHDALTVSQPSAGAGMRTSLVIRGGHVVAIFGSGLTRLGRVLGVENGRGLGLHYVLLGICGLSATAITYLPRRLWWLEELPDWVEA